MKKVNLVSSAILVSLVVGALVPSVVLAAEQPRETPATVTLTEDDGATKPVDPNKPDEKEDEEDPGNPETGNKGPLSLDVVPAGFIFSGTNLASAQTLSAKKATGQTTNHHYLQVTDNRDSDKVGWLLTVKQDGFLRNDTHTMAGTTITIPTGEARNSLNPAGAEHIIRNLITNQVTISEANQAIFATADINRGTGKGTSVNKWHVGDVKLMIPSNTARLGDYASTLTWTLSAASEE